MHLTVPQSCYDQSACLCLKNYLTGNSSFRQASWSCLCDLLFVLFFFSSFFIFILAVFSGKDLLPYLFVPCPFIVHSLFVPCLFLVHSLCVHNKFPVSLFFYLDTRKHGIIILLFPIEVPIWLFALFQAFIRTI